MRQLVGEHGVTVTEQDLISHAQYPAVFKVHTGGINKIKKTMPPFSSLTFASLDVRHPLFVHVIFFFFWAANV